MPQLTIDLTSEIWKIANDYLQNPKQSGSENLMSLCPFHDENGASFAMSLTTGVYFCHSCHAKGNLFTFFRDLGIPRAEVDLKYKVVIDAAKDNAPPPPDSTRPGVFDLIPIPDSFLGLFDHHPEGLLKGRFNEATLRHFEVGWDNWHGRITFPIRDIRGELTGISGRTTQPNVDPRYKIYDKEYKMWKLPERYGWDKRMVLYNAHNLYATLPLQSWDDSKIVVVEGFKAAMAVHQAGFTNVVGLLGSYLSWEQQWILERLSGTVYLFLDNNSAGINGTIRAGNELQPRSVHTRVIEYPDRLAVNEKAQPDDLDPDEFWEQLSEALPYNRWVHNLLDADKAEQQQAGH